MEGKADAMLGAREFSTLLLRLRETRISASPAAAASCINTGPVAQQKRRHAIGARKAGQGGEVGQPSHYYHCKAGGTAWLAARIGAGQEPNAGKVDGRAASEGGTIAQRGRTRTGVTAGIGKAHCCAINVYGTTNLW